MSADGVPSSDNKVVCKTGDIMYDASLYYRKKNVSLQMPNAFILLTIHRAENTDDPVRLKNIVGNVNPLSEKRFVFPVHPCTKKILKKYGLHFGNCVTLIEPVDYLEMLKYEEACTAVLTDKRRFFLSKTVHHHA